MSDHLANNKNEKSYVFRGSSPIQNTKDTKKKCSYFWINQLNGLNRERTTLKSVYVHKFHTQSTLITSQAAAFIESWVTYNAINHVKHHLTTFINAQQSFSHCCLFTKICFTAQVHGIYESYPVFLFFF